MCRAKDEGPRCSYGGRIRIEKAERRSAVIAERVAAYKESHEPDENGEYKLPKRLQRNKDIADARIRQAQIVWHATNAGVAQLEDKISQEEIRRQNIDPNLPERKRTSLNKGVDRKIASFRNQIDKGNADRQTMRANKALLGSDKRLIREKMMAQGAPINSRSQKAGPDSIAHQKNAKADKALELKSWTKEDVKDLAQHWVEDDTRTGWKPANPNVRVNKNHKALAGKKVEVLGTPQSSYLRMNTPDGTVGEVRVDMYTLKTDDGKYHVQTRNTTHGTNLQSSPYDTVGLEHGSLIGSKTGAVEREAQIEVQTFDTKEEAERYAKKARNSISQKLAVDTAIKLRDATVRWAAQTGKQKKLQTVHYAGEHLYTPAPAGDTKAKKVKY